MDIYQRRLINRLILNNGTISFEFMNEHEQRIASSLVPDGLVRREDTGMGGQILTFTDLGRTWAMTHALTVEMPDDEPVQGEMSVQELEIVKLKNTIASLLRANRRLKKTIKHLRNGIAAREARVPCTADLQTAAQISAALDD